MVTFKKDLKLGTMVPLVKTSDIDDGSITLEKMSVEMRKLIQGWNDTEELAGTLPTEIVSGLSINRNEDSVIIEGDVYRNNGSDDGYVPEDRYYTIPPATTDKAGVMSAQDKNNLDALMENGITEPITDEEIQSITG